MPSNPSGYPCIGETYVSWGACPSDDVPFEVTVECNGGSAGSCGWRVELTDELGFTDREFRDYQDQHRQHRNAMQDAKRNDAQEG